MKGPRPIRRLRASKVKGVTNLDNFDNKYEGNRQREQDHEQGDSCHQQGTDSWAFFTF